MRAYDFTSSVPIFANGAAFAAILGEIGNRISNKEMDGPLDNDAENVLSVDDESTTMLLASKGGKQNISVGGFDWNSNPADVEKAMKEAKSSGNQKHYGKLRGLLKVIKRGGRAIGPVIPLSPETLDTINPGAPTYPVYDTDTTEGFNACVASKHCT